MRSGGSSFLRSERSKSNSSIESQKAGSHANSEKDGILNAFPSQLLTELEHATSVVHSPPTLQPEESLTRDASGNNASVMSLDLTKGTMKQTLLLFLIAHIDLVTYTTVIHYNFHNNSFFSFLFCH